MTTPAQGQSRPRRPVTHLIGTVLGILVACLIVLGGLGQMLSARDAETVRRMSATLGADQRSIQANMTAGGMVHLIVGAVLLLLALWALSGTLRSAQAMAIAFLILGLLLAALGLLGGQFLLLSPVVAVMLVAAYLVLWNRRSRDYLYLRATGAPYRAVRPAR